MFKKFGFALMCLAVAYAAMVPVATRADAIPGNAFYIYNDSSQTLHFTYRCSDGSAGPFEKTIASEKANWYWANNGCNEYIIEKSTDYDDSSSRTLKYTLESGHKYKLLWDTSKNVWDVNEISAANNDVPDNAFYMYNDSDQVLHFSYKCSDDSAGPFDKTIEAGKANWYWAKNGCTEYIIEKSTDYDDSSTRTLKYTLDAGHKYKLLWDGDKNAWDVNEI